MLDKIFGLVSLPILSITVSLVVSTMLFYALWFRAEKALLLRISVLEKRAALLQLQYIPVSAAMQAILIPELTHFHEPEMDDLMVKLGPPFVLTDDQAARLDLLLIKRLRDPNVPQEERESAEMLRLTIKRVAREMDRYGVQAEPLIRVLIAHKADVE